MRDWSSPFATASVGRWRRNGNALTRTAVITAAAGGEHEPRSSSLQQHLLEQLAAALMASSSRRALMIAHRREIVNQTSTKLTAFAVHHGVIQAGDDDRLRPMAAVQVASIQTLRDQVGHHEDAARGHRRHRRGAP